MHHAGPLVDVILRILFLFLLHDPILLAHFDSLKFGLEV